MRETLVLAYRRLCALVPTKLQGKPVATTNPELLTILEAAEYLKVDPSTIRRWIKSGRLRVLRPGPRTVRVLRSELFGASSKAPLDEAAGESTRLPEFTEDYRQRLQAAVDRARRSLAEQRLNNVSYDPPSWVLINEARDDASEQHRRP